MDAICCCGGLGLLCCPAQHVTEIDSHEVSRVAFDATHCHIHLCSCDSEWHDARLLFWGHTGQVWFWQVTSAVDG